VEIGRIMQGANMKSISAVTVFLLALFVTAHVGLAAESKTEQPPDSNAQAGSTSGSDLFILNCAVCHGLDGHGHGPLADAMKTAPADLTQISKRNNGEFPAAKVADIIRNGGGVLGHGDSSMLAWGLYFSEKHNPAVGKAKIAALVDYLRDLQQK
jgi:mono/diheme cytochrome c family protein